MEYYLPTYDECKEIVNSYEGLQFYESIQEVDGYKISTFNYRLVGYEHFEHPLGESSPVKAFELRGLSFVFNKDGSVYKRFLLMNKFFNLNQVECTQYELLKNYKFKNVYNKEDGSVINFIQLPSGRILAKSKMMVDNVQALAAQKIYDENINIQNLVKWALSNDIMPIFEYVSPLNRVVLKYRESDLILIRLRDLNTGKYLDLDTYPELDKVNVVQPITKYSNFDEILEDYETLEGIEGCVVELEDNPHAVLVKNKTVWYFNVHNLMEDMSRENDIIRMILEETIDDYISKLDVEDQEVFDMIDAVNRVLDTYIHSEKRLIEEQLSILKNEYNSSIKEYSLNYNNGQKIKDKYFHMTLNVFKGYSAFDTIKTYILRHTYRLEQARTFLRTGEL